MPLCSWLFAIREQPCQLLELLITVLQHLINADVSWYHRSFWAWSCGWCKSSRFHPPSHYSMMRSAGPPDPHIKSYSLPDSFIVIVHPRMSAFPWQTPESWKEAQSIIEMYILANTQPWDAVIHILPIRSKVQFTEPLVLLLFKKNTT